MKNKGFTLVELLAVIAILAILVIIAIPNVLKMFNDSKKNAFMVQARKTANVAQEHTVLSNDKTFDCNSLLTGQKFKDCTATVDKNNQVSVDVLGSGAYENFLMVDVKPDGTSGEFIDLSKLNTINVPKTNSFLMTDDSSRFELVGADEYAQIITAVNSSSMTEDELNSIKKEYQEMINGIKRKDGKFYSDKEVFLLYKITIKDNEIGKYNLNWQNPAEYINKKSLMDKGTHTPRPDDILESYSLDESTYSVKGILNVNEADTYYFGVAFTSNLYSSGVSLTQDSTLLLKGNETEYVKLEDLPNNIKDYKDAGITIPNGKNDGNDYYSYTNFKKEVGSYKYNYIVKTSYGIKKLTRNIVVKKYTSDKCFAFDSKDGVITKYYDNEENDSSKPACPTDVVIPTKINNKDVLVIGKQAFCKTYEKNTQDGRITSVDLPETLTVIEGSAFYGNKIKTLTIPKNVTEIQSSAFGNNLLQTVTFKGAKIRGGCGAFNGEKHSAEVNSLSNPYC